MEFSSGRALLLSNDCFRSQEEIKKQMALPIAADAFSRGGGSSYVPFSCPSPFPVRHNREPDAVARSHDPPQPRTVVSDLRAAWETFGQAEWPGHETRPQRGGALFPRRRI